MRRFKTKYNESGYLPKLKHADLREIRLCHMKAKKDLKYCERCNVVFECKVDDILHCQCSKVQVSETTLNFLMSTPYDCLCTGCLSEIENEVNTVSAKKLI